MTSGGITLLSATSPHPALLKEERMDEFEEVKRILKENTHIHYAEYGGSGKIQSFDLDIETAALQICKLIPKSPDNPDGYEVEPKPDGSKLLTDEQYQGILNAKDDYYQLQLGIKEAEFQARIENLVARVDLIFKLLGITIENAKILWQALKERELKDVASLGRIIKLPVCRVCGHRHCSWFEDSEGVICDACINEIACSGKDD